MASSTTQKLTAFLVNPIVRVAQATAILHCINEYAFGITAVRKQLTAVGGTLLAGGCPSAMVV